MPDARVQLVVEVETEGVEQLTTLRRELEQLGAAGTAAFDQMDTSLAAVLDHLQQSRALLAVSTSSFLDAHRQLFSSLQPLFQGFFQRLLAGATNFRDLWKRLLADLLQFFLRIVAQMVAGWLSGLRQMSGGSLGNFLGGTGGATGGGGLLGFLAPLVSSGFGLEARAGGTPPIFPTGGGGGATSSNIALLQSLGINLHDLQIGSLVVPGGALLSGGLLGIGLGFTRGSRVLGALGGGAAGFALGGPIGAVIGAAVGFFAGLFGRGQQKHRATAIQVDAERALMEVYRQYERFGLDAESAISQIQSILAQAGQALGPLGKAGRGAMGILNQLAANHTSNIQQIERLRQQRREVIAGLPVPEFAAGGLVNLRAAIHSPAGKVLAFLHGGEAVLNRGAVALLGAQRIQAINQAGGGSGVAARAPSAPPSFQGGGLVPAGGPLLGGTVNIGPIVIQAADDPQATAEAVIREINRRARDKGLPGIL